MNLIDRLVRALEAYRTRWDACLPGLEELLREGDEESYSDCLLSRGGRFWDEVKLAITDLSRSPESMAELEKSREHQLLGLFLSAYLRPANDLLGYHVAMRNYFRGREHALAEHARHGLYSL